MVVGADRVAANGDVANKIGTYALAVAAARHQVPFVVVAPESTIDESMADGGDIRIEERPADEVTHLAGVPLAPDGTKAYNPAFDVTPAELITSVVTERRLLRPACATPDVAAVARSLYARGWMEGTSGNVSARLAEPAHFVITQSGCSKGIISAASTVTISTATGRPVRPGGRRPSAETAIHVVLYATWPDCGAVVHAHCPYATALSAYVPALGPVQRLRDRQGTRRARSRVSHRPGIRKPRRCRADRRRHHPLLRSGARRGIAPVLLIARHGATAWGPDLETARNRLECLEQLCQLVLLTRPKEHAS